MLHVQTVRTAEVQSGSITTLTIANDQVECSVILDGDRLVADRLAAQPAWSAHYGHHADTLQTDADFAFEVMWTDWQPPGKVNNAENPVTFTKRDFRCVGHAFADGEHGARELIVSFKGNDFPLQARLRYRLDGPSFYLRRELSLVDSAGGAHFLQRIWPRRGSLPGNPEFLNRGGFGQPIAFRMAEGGGFIGMEYPAADNTLDSACGVLRISCAQEMGEKIGKSWLAGAWVVEGITPDSSVKLWFTRYVDDIRIAPLRPYTLYNSWYDLRSPEYPKVPEGNVMNEKNILRIISLLRKNMIEKHGITLDAFVLDDGWDVYKSDWKLRAAQFPSGLKSIADTLGRTRTALGMWFGPIGGYSFRDLRVGWMKDHGYEVVGDQLCVAGKKYSALLEKRTTDFVAKDGVSFFKWDGFQFSCSEPDHGHPVGIYSRRAVMEAVIAMCRAVRAKNPATYLNITSGTWLSPWWVQYANQIWMQGEDYGYADVPSLSPRDAAITYRDLTLFDDLRTNNFWFPVQNLMTHGIIKGNLEKLGGENEPLDKFTNEVLLYLARGVSMWELYISPDILSEGEWDALARGLLWAKNRFSILSSTEMIGGDPGKRETYGYVHFKGRRGIIAARNPWIAPGLLRVELAPSLGLDRDASSLVLERVYPTRWVSPTLYRAGATIEIPLDGYMTALYEVSPLEEATMPLVAGATFDVLKDSAGEYRLALHDVAPDARLLNPASVAQATIGGVSVDLIEALPTAMIQPGRVTRRMATFGLTEDGSAVDVDFTLEETARGGMLAVLLTPSEMQTGKARPSVSAWLDGQETGVRTSGVDARSQWHTITVSAGSHRAHIQLKMAKDAQAWSGHASVWLIFRVKEMGTEVALAVNKSAHERPMPPRPWPIDEFPRTVFVGESDVTFPGTAQIH